IAQCRIDAEASCEHGRRVETPAASQCELKGTTQEFARSGRQRPHSHVHPRVSLVDVRPRGALTEDQTWHAKRLTAWNTTSQRRLKWRRKSASSCAATS